MCLVEPASEIVYLGIKDAGQVNRTRNCILESSASENFYITVAKQMKMIAAVAKGLICSLTIETVKYYSKEESN